MADGKMNETEWTKQICEILNKHFEKTKSSFHAKTEQKLPYGTVITGFDKDWKPDYAEKENVFATDLVIYEEQGDNRIIPRVVIEAKFKNVGTHDAMTYGKKAVLHKSIMPALRYGLMIGAMEDRDLQWRLFEHGGDFDFMFCFKAEEPTDEEQDAFFNLVDSETANSKKLEDMFASKNKKSGIYGLQKDIKQFKPNGK